MRAQISTRLGGLLLAALVATGCGAPADAPATATPAPAQSDPGAPLPAYPDPAAVTPAPAYPDPATAPTAPAYPYPAPTTSGAAPGGQVALASQALQTAALGAPVSRASVVASYPHDPTAYTQGLVYIGDDTLYEGTGLYGESSLREVDLATGAPLRPRVDLGPAYFGEGVAVVGERIFQLTWRECKGFIYDLSFARVGEFSYPTVQGLCATEGWGLAYDGQRLIMSNGTATLFFVDPAATASSGALAITGQVDVHDANGLVWQLNELEMVNGELFANIYTSELIARIDLATGRVNGYIDASGLRSQLSVNMSLPPPGVLNGIAYDPSGDRLFVTGKLWPNLFEIDLPIAYVYLPLAAAPPSVPRLGLWS